MKTYTIFLDGSNPSADPTKQRIAITTNLSNTEWADSQKIAQSVTAAIQELYKTFPNGRVERVSVYETSTN